MTRRDFHPDRDALPYRGALYRYDLLREVGIAAVVLTLLVIVLSLLFGSPDPKPVTFSKFAAAKPANFVEDALSQLDGTSETAEYGPPYNTGSGSTQRILGICLQCLEGQHIPVNAPSDFVLNPLTAQPSTPVVQAAVRSWNAATPAQRQTWVKAYGAALAHAHFPASGAPPLVIPAGYGPVGVLMAAEYALARTGVLEGALLEQGNNPPGQFYRLDYARPLLFLEDGEYLSELAEAQGLGGGQWGLMNETGGFPGQFWLFLYAFPYQIEAIANSQNADIISISFIALVTLLLFLTPFIPGWRSIPRRIPLHRVIWRRWYSDWDPERPT